MFMLIFLLLRTHIGDAAPKRVVAIVSQSEVKERVKRRDKRLTYGAILLV